MKDDFDNTRFEMMNKDLENWKGIFYFNRKDPSVFVPKITPMTGSTLNFGNPYTYISMIAIILIIVLYNYIF